MRKKFVCGEAERQSQQWRLKNRRLKVHQGEAGNVHSNVIGSHQCFNTISSLGLCVAIPLISWQAVINRPCFWS
jgi:hypothetical protein